MNTLESKVINIHHRFIFPVAKLKHITHFNGFQQISILSDTQITYFLAFISFRIL